MIQCQSLRGLLTCYHSNQQRLLTLGAALTDILQLACSRGCADNVTQNMFRQSSNLSMYLLAKIIIKTHG